MNNLESGLYLPIRFYNATSEQDRYKRHSLEVALADINYPFVDCTNLAPFQLVLTGVDYSSSVVINAFCADTNEIISLPYNAAYWNEAFANDRHYLSYLGEDDFGGFQYLHNGLFYLGVAVTISPELVDPYTLYFYSELFMISNCTGQKYDIDDYRIYADGDNLRAINPTDLRIT